LIPFGSADVWLFTTQLQPQQNHTHTHAQTQTHPQTTTEGLANALRTYTGAVILASHDIRFVDEVLSATSGAVRGSGGGGAQSEVWVVGKGDVKKWTKGGVAEYAEGRLEKIRAGAAAAAAAAGGGRAAGGSGGGAGSRRGTH